MARWLHVGTVAAMAAVALVAPLGAWYLAGVGGVAALLAWEQSLVRADDLSRVKQAFDLNGYVGLFYLAATAGALYAG
jgi:4-hydroxybenzoate polyprenyltransferase